LRSQLGSLAKIKNVGRERAEGIVRNLPTRVNYTAALLLVDEFGKVENFASQAAN
jgi:hypothetical protein